MQQTSQSEVTAVHMDQWPPGLADYLTDILAAMLVADYQQSPPTVTTPRGSNGKSCKPLVKRKERHDRGPRAEKAPQPGRKPEKWDADEMVKVETKKYKFSICIRAARHSTLMGQVMNRIEVRSGRWSLR
jgi:hypothetical protein